MLLSSCAKYNDYQIQWCEFQLKERDVMRTRIELTELCKNFEKDMRLK